MCKKVAIDIGHPAHVHYFKNIISILKNNNVEVYISARDKDITIELLNELNLNFFNRGKGSNTLFGKVLYIFKADYILYKFYKTIKPDIFISFASSYLAHVSFLLNRPHIVLDDTEHANLNHSLYKYFSKYIITPTFFKKNITKKQLRCNCFFEQLYLKDIIIKKDIFKYNNPFNLEKNRKNILIRFVSWDALHDINQKRMSLEDKISIVKELSQIANIYISSEGNLPKEIEKFELKIPKDKIHLFMLNVDLLISESGTMATEGCLLGVPTILTIDQNLANQFGNFNKLIEYKLLKIAFKKDKILKNSVKLLRKEYKNLQNTKCDKIWNKTEDPNNFIMNILAKEISLDFTNSNTSKK